MTSDYCRIVVHWGVRFLQKEGEPRNTILPPRALWWPPLLRRWRSTAHRHSTPYSSSSCRNPGYSQGTAEKLGTTKTCVRDSVIEVEPFILRNLPCETSARKLLSRCHTICSRESSLKLSGSTSLQFRTPNTTNTFYSIIMYYILPLLLILNTSMSATIKALCWY